MNKYILILKSSPRENGNSAVLADRIAAGAKVSGAQVETFSLHNMKIQPCDACDTCRETGGVCIIKDDMQDLYPQLLQADVIVLASPVYWFTISAQLKLCIDRWYALESSEGNGLAGKKFALVLTYGDSDLYTSGGINAIHTFESIFRYLKADLAGLVHCSAGDVGDVENKPELLEEAYHLGKMLASA